MRGMLPENGAREWSDIPQLKPLQHHPTLEALYLKQCHLRASHVASLLKMGGNLKTLEVVWDEKRVGTDSENGVYISFGQLGKAISDHAPNLETLVLDASRRWAIPEETDRFYQSMWHIDTLSGASESVYRLRHLRRLVVGENAIWTTRTRGYERSGSAIRQVVPRCGCLKELVIVSIRDNELIPDVPGWEEDDYDEYRKWQDADLRNYLLEDKVGALEYVEVRGGEGKHIWTAATVKQLGWKVRSAYRMIENRRTWHTILDRRGKREREQGRQVL